MAATIEIFRKYLHPIFIETGSHVGNGIRRALDAGFKNIYSIELSYKFYKNCCLRFEDELQVRLYKGDASEVLPEILKDINEPVTFWLDAHYSGDDTAIGEHHSSLLQELDAIKQHPVKTHTILMDDIRIWENWAYLLNR